MRTPPRPRRLTSIAVAATTVLALGTLTLPGASAADTPTWTPIGPNSAGAEVTPSHRSGVAVATADGSTVPWLTQDDGSTWSPLPDAPLDYNAGEGFISFDNDHPDRFWFAADQCTTGCTAIVRTDDLGKTWERQYTGGSGGLVTLLQTVDGAVVAVKQNALVVSTDDGATWTEHPIDVGHIADAASDGEDVFLTSGKKIWRIPMAKGVPGAPAVSYTPENQYSIPNQFSGGDGFVVANVWIGGAVLSSDGGETWRTVREAHILDAVEASGDSLYVADDGKAAISHDLGATWTDVEVPSRVAAHKDFDVWGGDYTVSTTSGIYRPQGNGYGRIGIPAATIYDLVGRGDTVLAATDSGVYTGSVGSSALEWGEGDGEGMVGASVRNLVPGTDVVWRTVATAFGGADIQRSRDDGATWTTTSSVNGQPTSYWVDPKDPRHQAVGYWGGPSAMTGIFETKDGGETWTDMPTAFQIDALTANGAGLLAGGEGGLWQVNPAGERQLIDGRVGAITRVDNTLVAGGSDVWVSKDDGDRWTAAGLDAPAVGDIAVTSDAWYAGGAGVLRSTDHGKTWSRLGSGLPTNVESLAVSGNGDWLYAGLNSAGAYRLRLP